MTRTAFVSRAALALSVATGPVAALPAFAATNGGSPVGPPRSAAERAFARSVSPLSAHDVTGNLIRYTGTHVSFGCTVTSIVARDTMIGQCGHENEPVDLYVMMPTAGLHIGTKIRVLGEMLAPAQWVDVTGHSWYTPMVRAMFVDRT